MKLFTGFSREFDRYIPRRWLALARGGWIVCALGLLANFVVGVPAYYRGLFIPCTLSDPGLCVSGQLVPQNFQALQHLHLSVQVYAASATALATAVSLLFWVVGILIFWRKGQDWMGLFVSFVLIVYGSVGVNDTFLVGHPTAQTPVFILALIPLFVVLQWSALGAFLLTFPTGRFAPRWSWVIIPLWLGQAGLFFLGISNGPPLLLAGELLLVCGSTIGIQVYRYVRVYDAVQRQQTKWFVFAFAVTFTLYILVIALPGVIPALAAPGSWYQFFDVGIAPIIFFPIPLGIGIAILRYRLWEIDRVINRTLVYTLLTAILAVIYAGLIIALQSLVRALTGAVAEQPLIIVASTLVIAALVQPLRRRIQASIDRRFYRRKYDATRTLAAFSATLRNEVDLTTLSEHLIAVVQETMQPTHVSLWLRPPEHHANHRVPWRANPPVSSEDGR